MRLKFAVGKEWNLLKTPPKPHAAAKQKKLVQSNISENQKEKPERPSEDQPPWFSERRVA
jgi:hypothetical protein